METEIDDTSDLREADPTIGVLDLVRCVIMGIIGVVCIVGNSLVIRTLICFKYPKIPMYVAIGGLALADMLRAFIEVPANIINWTHNNDIATTAWCKASYYLKTSSMYIAAGHLVGLSIIRCILLNDRAHSRTYVPQAVVGSAIIWVVTLLTNIPNIMSQDKDEIVKECVEVDSELSVSDERNLWIRISFSYLVPLFLIGIVYFITYWFSKRYFEDSYSRRERRLSKMVSILIIIWAVCKLPFEVINLVLFYKSREIEKFFQNPVTQPIHNEIISNFLFLEQVEMNMECLSLVDLALRPIFYAKLSYYFSKSFDEVINCTACRESQNRKSRLVDSKCNIRHARISERVSESESQVQTPLTEIVKDAKQDEERVYGAHCIDDEITVLSTTVMPQG